MPYTVMKKNVLIKFTCQKIYLICTKHKSTQNCNLEMWAQ